MPASDKQTTSIAGWRDAFREAVLTPAELCAMLQLDETGMALAEAGRAQFALRIPPAYLRQIRPGDPNDPLLRQVLPLADEDRDVAGFGCDPVGDLTAEKQPGLLHKYHGRVLLTLTGACAIHCRYCFRRHFPYGESNPTRSAWHTTLDYIRNDASIKEVIFSGGDPLSLNDSRLAGLAADLQCIPHLKRLRIHSRMPIVLPERVTEKLLQWLTDSRLQPVLVVHVNHPQEFGAPAASALRRLHDAGIHLLNQAVLLRHVNDSAQTLIGLSETLFENNVLPYYLHQLDRVAGAAHYTVDDVTARTLYEQLRRALSGYLVPRLVREIEGVPYKLPLL